MDRPERDEVFMEIARTLSKRGSCRRLYVGCVIVMDQKHITTSGVNGPQTWDCDELGCDTSQPCKHSKHAEENAIIFANKHGISLKGATLYCTHGPCLECSKKIIEAGITRVVYERPFRVFDGIRLMQEYKIEVIQL